MEYKKEEQLCINELETRLSRKLIKHNLIAWDSFGFEIVDNLVTGIGLFKTELKELPNCLWDLISLQRISLVGTKLSEIPLSIGKLINLEELYIGNNGLIAIPKQIGLLSNLKVLYIHENNITSIPKQIFELSKLEEISISSTIIEDQRRPINSNLNPNCKIFINGKILL